MIFLLEWINVILYDSKRRVLKILDLVMIANVITSILFFLRRYGYYYNSRQELEDAFALLDWNFWVFIIAFGIRLVFEERIWFTLQKSWFEGFIILVSLFHVLFDYQVQEKLFEWMGLVSGEEDYLSYQYIISFFFMALVGIELVRFSARLGKLQISFAATFLYSFIFLILGGTFLLMLPAMTAGKVGIGREEAMPFIDALFTSASAACVTGLTLEHTGVYFTFKGQIIILLLIQIGGIGIVSFATFFATFLSKGVGIKQQIMIQDYLSSESLATTKGLLRQVIFLTLFIEGIGSVLIYYSWDSDLPFVSTAQKIFFSVFHSVSAFCNAGFSLFGAGLATTEDTVLSTNPLDVHNLNNNLNIHRMYVLHFVIAWLIILGGIGFGTIDDLRKKLNPIPLLKNGLVKSGFGSLKISTVASVHTTALLLLIGTVGFLTLELHQMRDRNIIQALITAFFQSVTCRTAGFNTIDFTSIQVSTAILTIFLMFIGASPGSCGGGIKTSTFYLILRSSIANIRGHERIVLAKRTIPQDLVIKAFSVFIFAATYNILVIFALSITESHLVAEGKILHLVFEEISAFTTTGLSMGITSSLSDAGKLLITVSMYIGRVGTLTLAIALSKKVISKSYRYPEGHIMIG